MKSDLAASETQTRKPEFWRRACAGAIDYTIIMLLITVEYLHYGEVLPITGRRIYPSDGFVAWLPELTWFVFTVGIECVLGATIGNELLGMKPVPLKNTRRKISFWRSLLRHLPDTIDFVFFGIFGYFIILKTKNGQRLGDFLARSVVVMDD
jgi:uncharacterized RDD family membrane protein YckC